jgi:hypothetical protein
MYKGHCEFLDTIIEFERDCLYRHNPLIKDAYVKFDYRLDQINVEFGITDLEINDEVYNFNESYEVSAHNIYHNPEFYIDGDLVEFDEDLSQYEKPLRIEYKWRFFINHLSKLISDMFDNAREMEGHYEFV